MEKSCPTCIRDPADHSMTGHFSIDGQLTEMTSKTLSRDSRERQENIRQVRMLHLMMMTMMMASTTTAVAEWEVKR